MNLGPVPSPRGVGPVAALAFSPDGRTLAVAGNDGRVTLWGWPEWKRGKQFATKGKPRALAFSANGTTLLSACESRLVFCDLQTGQQRRPDGPVFVGCAAFSPDGRLLALGQGPFVGLVKGSDGGQLRRLSGPRSERPSTVILGRREG